MPTRAKKYCTKCSKLAVWHGLCDDHAQQYKQSVPQSRYKRGNNLYNTQEWKRLRCEQLGKEPLCEECLKQNRLTPATVVDHKRPHHGDETLFFDPGNLQSLCKMHHDQKTAKEDGAFGNRPQGAV